MSNDKTIRDVGTIDSSRKAVELMKDFYKTPSKGRVSVLALNVRNEVIDIKHYQTDMSPLWRSSVAIKSAEVRGMNSVVVVYDDTDRELEKMVDIFSDLGSKLRDLGKGLTDVIAIGANSYYSYAEERTTRI